MAEELYPDEQPTEPAENVVKPSLKLDEEGVRGMMDFARKELEDAMKEMGRGKDGRTEPGSWLDRRRINQLWYEGDLEWRKAGCGETMSVFASSNYTRGDGKRYVRHMAAKVCDDLIGTSPFFAALKKDTATSQDADQNGQTLMRSIEEFTQTAVDASNLPDALREAVELALVRNEAVVKLRNVFQPTAYVGPATVLVDASGQPVVTPIKRLYVYENDDMLPVPNQPGMVGLEKDASFMVSEQEAQAFTYKYFEELAQTLVQREGLEARILDPRDFICRLKVDDIHQSPLNAHLYDETPAELKRVYGNTAASNGYFCGPDSGEKQPIESQGEQPNISQDSQWVHVAEIYLKFDADGDGLEEEILLIVDRGNMQKPIFYDYLHKHMKKRPFEVLHGLRKVPSRWYGIGIYTDKFDSLMFVDKTFNRINLKNSKTCTATAVRRKSIEEWSDMKLPIVLGGDEVLTLDDKWQESDGPWIQQIRLIEVSDEEIELLQQMLQAMDQEFGYISAADASATGLNTSKTATGIASIERSGNNIVKAVERVQAKGITAILEQAVDIILENMDPTRLALTKNAELLTLNREEIRDMKRDVRLLLTRSRSTELLASNAQALDVANAYFDLMEARPRRAKAMRPMYLAQLKALEVQDADEILPEVTDEMIKAAEQAQAPKEPPKESISIPYKDLLPSEKAQVLQGIGITPGSPDEAVQVATAKTAADAASEAAKAAAKQPAQPAPQQSEQ